MMREKGVQKPSKRGGKAGEKNGEREGRKKERRKPLIYYVLSYVGERKRRRIKN